MRPERISSGPGQRDQYNKIKKERSCETDRGGEGAKL